MYNPRMTMTGRQRVEAAVLGAMERLGKALDEIRGDALTEKEAKCAVCGETVHFSGRGRPRRTCKGKCAAEARRIYNRRLYAERKGRGDGPH